MDSENQSDVDYSAARHAIELALRDAESAQASLATAIQGLQALSDMLDKDDGQRDDVNQTQRVIDLEMERAASHLKTSMNAAAFAKPHFASLCASWAGRRGTSQ